MAALTLLTGSGNPNLATAVAGELGTTLAACVVEHFPDGEQHVQIQESVRDHDVFLIQSTCPPVSDNLLQLLLLADASWRAGAHTITAVVPYFGYARQDRRKAGREPVAARLVADLIATSGIDRIVVVDLHTPATEAFFSIPVEHLSAVELLSSAIAPLPENAVIVAPDLGAVRLAEQYSRRLRLPMATVHKVRTGPEAVHVREIVGNVRDRTPVIVDDMISTGHTVATTVRALLAAGCVPDITVLVSHGLFVGSAERVLGDVPIGLILTTDSVPPRADLPLPIKVTSLTGLLVDVVRRLHGSESLSDLIVHQ